MSYSDRLPDCGRWKCLATERSSDALVKVATLSVRNYGSGMPRWAERGWRRRRPMPAIAIGALVAAVAVVVVIANDGHDPDVSTFNACLSDKPFLTTAVWRSHGRVIDTIKDRASGLVVGKFAMFLTSRAAETYTSTIGPPSGSGSSNGRFLLLTLSPDGRDAHAMFSCSEVEIPGP